MTVRSPAGQLTVQTPLLGLHGAANAALAALAAQRLGLPDPAIQVGAAQTRWPGRLEKVSWRGRDLLLDGAHNPDGARALVSALRGLGVDKVPLVFGAASDKDLPGMLAALAPLASQVVVTRSRLSPRAADPHVLAGLVEGVVEAGVTVRVAPTPAEALGLLPPGLSVVCGSLYLVGEVRPLLRGEVAEERERWQ